MAAWLCRRVKFICRDRGGLSGGLLPVLAGCRSVRGEPVR
ncbi:plasmid mobilization protein, partial [Salmonella enterica]|nr:plasmid mobilization protein [Salmonella enterica]